MNTQQLIKRYQNDDRLFEMQWTEGDLEVASSDDEYNMLKCAAFEEGAARQLAKADLAPAAFMVRFNAILYEAIVEQVKEQDVARAMPAPLRDVVEPRCQNLQFQDGTNFDKEWELLFTVRDINIRGVGVYLSRVRTRMNRRIRRLIIQDLREKLNESSDDELLSDATVEELQQAADALQERDTAEGYSLSAPRVRSVMSEFGFEEEQAVRTGFSEWDELISPSKDCAGMAVGGVHVISGHTGQGKSTLLLSVLKHMLTEEEVPCAYINYELTESEFLHRFGSALTGVHSYSRSRFCSEEAAKGLTPQQAEQAWTEHWMDAGERIADYINNGQLSILNAPPTDADRVMDAISELAAQGHRVVFIDTVNRLSYGDLESRQQMRHIMQQLDVLARRQEIVLVLAAQENREKRLRKEKRPTLYDIADSSEIEKTAHSVTQIYRSDVHEDKTYVEAIVNKSRARGCLRDKERAFPMQYNHASMTYSPAYRSTANEDSDGGAGGGSGLVFAP